MIPRITKKAGAKGIYKDALIAFVLCVIIIAIGLWGIMMRHKRWDQSYFRYKLRKELGLYIVISLLSFLLIIKCIFVSSMAKLFAYRKKNNLKLILYTTYGLELLFFRNTFP